MGAGADMPSRILDRSQKWHGSGFLGWGCLCPLYAGTLPAEDLVLAWQNGWRGGRGLGLWARGTLTSSALGHSSVSLFACERFHRFLESGVHWLLECPLSE